MTTRLIFVFTALVPTLLRAQFGASIQGSIADASGAGIPNAKVSLTSRETERKQSTTASGEGFYRFGGLAPGTYSITAEVPNFKRQVIENVVVAAEQTQGVNFTLEAGDVTQSITVTAAATPLIATESAQLGGDLTTREVNTLPQFGRDPYELIRVIPNVTADMGRNASGNSVPLPNTTGPGGSNSSIFQTENQLPVSANGQRLSNNEYLVDGVSVNSLNWGGAAVLTPNQESVREMLVLTNAYSAEWGRNSGAQIAVISKNGTNQLHGSGLFHYDSPSLNAYNKWGGPSAPPVRNNNLYRQFGASVGGPLIKNKLFWFFSYEGLRQTTNGVYEAWVETPDYRQAVIAGRPNSVTTQIFQSPGIAPRVLSVLTAPCPAPFAAGTCQQIPGKGIDVGSMTGQTGQYNSLTGGGLDGVADLEYALLASPATLRGNQYNGRVDFTPTARDSISGILYFTSFFNLSADTTTGSRPMADVNFSPLNSAVTALYTHTFSPTILNEARANLTRFAANQITSNTGTVNWGIPRLEVQGYSIGSQATAGRLYFGALQGDTTPGVLAQNTYEVRDILSKVAGNHALKFGVEIRQEQDNSGLQGSARPDYVFNGLWELANSAPIYEGIAANPATGGVPNLSRYFRTRYRALFAQDDWKIRPNLTLNLGLRWEYFGPPSEARGTLSNLLFGSQGMPNSKVAVVNSLYNPAWRNFGPRVGFAWSPRRSGSNFVVRGGFGMFYDRIPEALFTNSAANPPFLARYGLCCGTASSPFDNGAIQYSLGSSNSPFSYPSNPALAQGINPITGTPAAGPVEIWGSQPYMPNAMVYVYSFGIEYRLPWKVTVDLGYSGSTGHHLIRLVNQVFLYGNNNNLATGAAFSAVYFPQPDDNSNYNAGIVTLRKQYDRALGTPLQFVFNYRWAKSLDNTSYEGPGSVTNQTYPQNNRTEWGPSDFDVTQIISLSTVWDIPTPGKLRSVARSILGGWQLAPIISWHTGFPWTPVIGESVQTPGGPTLSPIRPTAYYGGAGHSESNQAFMTGSDFPNGGAAYFDIKDSGAPGIGRNSWRGPHFFQTDLSFAKNTRLPFFFGESANLELRANFFNIFNQLNLTPLTFGGSGTHPDLPFFGESSGALAGRVVELQARFNF
ncbi:MAG: TonB-dependent receptor [Acidobacteriia bacterium]|nr:TonB-dependent receptor [Terriglobia bacterium]